MEAFNVSMEAFFRALQMTSSQAQVMGMKIILDGVEK